MLNFYPLSTHVYNRYDILNLLIDNWYFTLQVYHTYVHNMYYLELIIEEAPLLLTLDITNWYSLMTVAEPCEQFKVRTDVVSEIFF